MMATNKLKLKVRRLFFSFNQPSFKNDPAGRPDDCGQKIVSGINHLKSHGDFTIMNFPPDKSFCPAPNLMVLGVIPDKMALPDSRTIAARTRCPPINRLESQFFYAGHFFVRQKELSGNLSSNSNKLLPDKLHPLKGGGNF